MVFSILITPENLSFMYYDQTNHVLDTNANFHIPTLTASVVEIVFFFLFTAIKIDLRKIKT
jgi:hypothetical protein